MIPRGPASLHGMPDQVTRQWVIEHAGWADRVFVKTPDWADVPIPEDQRDDDATHAVYLVDCDHDEDYCGCSDDDSVEWTFVEYLNINEVLNT